MEQITTGKGTSTRSCQPTLEARKRTEGPAYRLFL